MCLKDGYFDCGLHSEAQSTSCEQYIGGLHWVMCTLKLVVLTSSSNTANMYTGITVKTHVKTVKLNYSGLLYNEGVFAIHCTVQECRWHNKLLYFKFTVIPLHLEQQLNVKNTVEKL